MSLQESPLTPPLLRRENWSRGSLACEESYWTLRSIDVDVGLEETGAGGQGTIFSSSLTLILTSIGSGVFALPFAFSCAGVGFGSAIVVAVAWLSWLSAYALGCCAEATGYFSYQEIALAAWGRRGGLVVEVLILEVLGGAMAAVLTLIFDALPAVVGLALVDPDAAASCIVFGKIFVVCFVLLPMSCARSWHALRYFNAIGVACNLAVCAYVAACGVLRMSGGGGLLAFRYAFETDVSRAVQAVPILMLSFGMHVQAPAVYGELQGRSVRRFCRAVGAQTVACLLIYIPMGVLGVRLFPPEQLVPGDVLLGFDARSSATAAMRASVGLTCVCVFPLLSMPCRSTLDHLLFQGGGNVAAPGSWARHAAEALVIVLVVSAISAGVGNLSRVTAVTGATGGALLCFVFPFCFYESLCRAGHVDPGDGFRRCAMRRGAAAAFVLTLISLGALLCNA